MLETENLGKVIPGVESSEEGVKVYRRFYSEEQEQANGVLAIIVSKFTPQPYSSLASLFCELSYEGVQSLLGLTHTTGTIPNALPPPISTLLASFNLPCNPNENGLTDGARALAKHACRSSSGYWGSLNGNGFSEHGICCHKNLIRFKIGTSWNSTQTAHKHANLVDELPNQPYSQGSPLRKQFSVLQNNSNKNRLAMDVINSLIAHCCWLNVHIVPPHGVVFEIRVADGYGARWTEDGSKFIGFLEPYMQDGHSKGWKH